ncbi:T-cell surface glycoprotein CD3 epsilon chain [Trichosurus vulpecula]|uniref:T-cell surface glycoprotein CD3 epsilon chain n=1 Tax=Trichosurus vulpecula TaxID=9337 RepID=UPI00186ADFB2|nr:T-cell surface glycoprotein CD3 epsilon chain [Trichosurus vulpecula]XP_036603428.1 T-cell surface glycoprotein CD3 epsilon chain [Trichosurus vulpecula]
MMQLEALRTVLGFCLLSACVRGQDLEEEKKNYKFEVYISGTEVTLTCPEVESELIAWKKNDVEIKGVDTNTLTLKDSETEYSGHFHCKKKSSDDHEGYYLYLKARVCHGCMEMEVLTVAGIVIADIFITLGVLLLVYYWSKGRKAKANPVGRGGGAGGRTRGANKERPPPVPNPDYEPIRKGQRDLYAGLNQRAL